MNTQEVFEKREELAEAMHCGDLEKVAEILEVFSFVRNGILTDYSKASAYIARMTLCTAAMEEKKDNITEPMAMLLIDYLAPVVDMFEFLYSTLGYTRSEGNEDYAVDIPSKLRLALLRNKFSSEVSEAIAALSPEEFKSLAMYILAEDDICCLSTEFARPIMAYCYWLVWGDLTFATMANNVFDQASHGPCGFTITVIQP